MAFAFRVRRPICLTNLQNFCFLFLRVSLVQIFLYFALQTESPGQSPRAQLVKKALLQGVPAAAAAGRKSNPSFPAACTSEITPLTKFLPTMSGTQKIMKMFFWEKRRHEGNEYPGLHGYKRSAACDDDIADCLSCCLSLVRSRSYNSSSQTVHPSEASTAPAAPQAGPGSPVRRRFHRLPCFK